MGKLFGTDGIRGVANETLDAKLAYRVGQAAAISLADDSGTKPTVVIGKDTRISSDMLEGALVAGLTACGCNAILLGVIPTPAVAYLTVYLHADAGVVISASHNPYEHNGIKMFSSEGFKLSDALEARIEELILREGELPVKTHGQIGQVMSGSFAAEYYLDHLASTVENLEPLRVLIDCANGAASTTARYLFGRFPLQAEYLNDKPNGVNINEGCGSTHLEALCAAVKDGGYDLGIAFDGDADRCLTVDEQGNPIDGDRMMAICAESLEQKGRLQGDGFVATVMSNIGLHRFCKERGLRLLCANVGDRNVLELMQKEGMRPRRRAVGPHHLPRLYAHRRRPAGRTAAAEYPLAQQKEGERACIRRPAVSAAAQKRPRQLQRPEDRHHAVRFLAVCHPRGGGGARRKRPRAHPPVGHGAAHPRHGRGRDAAAGAGRDGPAGAARRKSTKTTDK